MYKPVDHNIFLNWAQQHFVDIKEANEKIRLNSIYCDHLGGDEKHHLWCRPYTGYYHCYKSGKKGSLYDLVMDVEKCSYDAAVDILGGEQTLLYLEAKLEAFLASESADDLPKEEKKLRLPENSISVKNLLSPYKNKVLNYLNSRKIPPDGLYYCIDGEFKGRIIIPYYNCDGELVYFNGRDIVNPKPYLRYRGPESGTGFKKDEVVWMSFFPKKGSKIHLTEGEFDAMTLNQCGLRGCATGGKDVSYKQILLIRNYEICMAFDRDESGKQAISKLGIMLLENGVKKVTFVRPPNPYKDWNEMLTGNKDKPALSEKVIKAYVLQNEKVFNELTSALLDF